MKGQEVIKAAIVFISYGPYHLARAKALTEALGIRPSFIELAPSIGTHPWGRSEVTLPFDMHTLAQAPYESCSYPSLARSLRDALDRIDPAVVVTASFRPFIMLSGARWARARRKHTVLFYETTRWDRHRSWFVETLKRWTIRRYYDAAFVGGEAHRNYLVQLGMPEGRIWEPYDVVDNDYFAKATSSARAHLEFWRARLRLPERYFLYVGRYAPETNLVRLLEAYRRYRASHLQGWSLVLVGDGPERQRLEHFITNNRLEEVLLKPFAQLQELPAYYALAGCFVLPSTVDPWGLVVNEAMACGLPVMVSRLCGCGFDLVKEARNGFLFDPYDIDALAGLLGRMSSLDEDAWREMAAQSRRIISAFTPDIWAEKLAQCIRMVVRESGG
jgi:1,2-diacylglycerol 3-alpha-glucosyltransferase